MQAVILAAGRGVRMGNLTKEIPKPMLEIKNKPILAHKIEALPKEIGEVIIIVGYLGGIIEKYFSNEYNGRKISYIIQEELNGTGGAISLARDMLDDRFIVMMGDDLYMSEDVEKMTRNRYAVLGYEVQDPSRFGVVVSDEKGNLKDIVEKPTDIKGPALANIGLYALGKEFFDYPLVDIGNGEYGLPQTLASMAKDYEIKIEKAEDWFPIGRPEDFEKSQEAISRFI